MDVNSPRMVTSLIPEMSRAKHIKNCDAELYCGLPYIVPVMTIMWYDVKRFLFFDRYLISHNHNINVDYMR